MEHNGVYSMVLFSHYLLNTNSKANKLQHYKGIEICDEWCGHIVGLNKCLFIFS